MIKNMKRLTKSSSSIGSVGYDAANRECAILYVDGQVLMGSDHYNLMLQYINDNNLEEDYFDKKDTEWASACLVNFNNVPHINVLKDKLPTDAFEEAFDFWEPNTNRVFVDDYIYSIDIKTLANKMKNIPELSGYDFYINQPEETYTLEDWFGSIFIEENDLVEYADYEIHFHRVL